MTDQNAPRKRPFRTLGARLLSYGRQVMRNYEAPDSAPAPIQRSNSGNARRSIGGNKAAPVRATWKAQAASQSLIWRETGGAFVQRQPQEGGAPSEPNEMFTGQPQRREAPTQARPTPIRPMQSSAQPPAQRTPQQPPKQRSGKPPSPLENRLQRILDFHETKNAQREEIKRKKIEKIQREAEEIQRKAEESGSEARPLPRRGRANFDYVTTSSLLSDDDKKEQEALQRKQEEESAAADTVEAEAEPISGDGDANIPTVNMDGPTAVQRAAEEATDDDADWWDVDNAFEPENAPSDESGFPVSGESTGVKHVESRPAMPTPSPNQQLQRNAEDAQDAEIISTEDEDGTDFFPQADPLTPTDLGNTESPSASDPIQRTADEGGFSDPSVENLGDNQSGVTHTPSKPAQPTPSPNQQIQRSADNATHTDDGFSAPPVENLGDKQTGTTHTSSQPAQRTPSPNQQVQRRAETSDNTPIQRQDEVIYDSPADDIFNDVYGEADGAPFDGNEQPPITTRPSMPTVESQPAKRTASPNDVQRAFDDNTDDPTATDAETPSAPSDTSIQRTADDAPVQRTLQDWDQAVFDDEDYDAPEEGGFGFSLNVVHDTVSNTSPPSTQATPPNQPIQRQTDGSDNTGDYFDAVDDYFDDTSDSAFIAQQ
ncbi:MAG: hypothetical protein AAF125_04110, partial [Chloroflexota bacterium]